MGFEIISFDFVESTNDTAKKMCLLGKDKFAVLAHKQTKARGRFAREWVAQAGGLYLSIGFSVKDISSIHFLTLGAALAVRSVSSDIVGKNAKVKWPNDVYIDDKKVCGILTEIVSGKGNYVIIGIGLNVNQRNLPDKLLHKATTFFFETKQQHDVEAIANLILEKFEHYYFLHQKRQYDAILSEWKKYSYTLGKHITVQSIEGDVSGEAVDIDSNGHLVLKLDDGTLKTISEGDIFI